MGEMVERVARAIADAQPNGPGWRYCVPDAIAAIAAMREPTDAMRWAKELPHIGPDDCADLWRAMIDAELGASR